MSYLHFNHHSLAHRGSIAVFLVVILSLLLMTVTVLGARLAMSETRQASEVDQSDAAYYAAEAGVEEASRRLDANDRQLDLEDIFPEQYDALGQQHGDRAVLSDTEGEFDAGTLSIEPDNFSDHGDYFGRLAWRQRKVYEEELPPFGTQVKDESVELDATELRERCSDGSIVGESGFDCSGSDIFDSFGGVEYCWNSRVDEQPEIALTVLSYPAGNASDITTTKFIFGEGFAGAQTGNGIAIRSGSSDTEYDCKRIHVDNSATTRYIFRIRPLYTSEQAQEEPNQYRLDYRTEAFIGGYDTYVSYETRTMFLPDDTVLIDVVGQSGDTRRRIVARKERSGKILGIFDYTLYSGSPDLPLCRAGVEQSEDGLVEVYNTNLCVVKPL